MLVVNLKELGGILRENANSKASARTWKLCLSCQHVIWRGVAVMWRRHASTDELASSKSDFSWVQVVPRRDLCLQAASRMGLKRYGDQSQSFSRMRANFVQFQVCDVKRPLYSVSQTIIAVGRHRRHSLPRSCYSKEAVPTST